jgi:hypothetical protein
MIGLLKCLNGKKERMKYFPFFQAAFDATAGLIVGRRSDRRISN